MRRTGFKKPTFKEVKAKLEAKHLVKRSKRPLEASKKKKTTRRTTNPTKALKKRLWELCKNIIRTKYGNTCYTCGKTGLSGGSWQTGHFIASSVCGANLRYDLRNLRPQCYYCNINLGGNGSVFYRNLVAREGQDYVDQLFRDKEIIVKADELFYKQKISAYEIIWHDLKTTFQNSTL